MLNLLLVAGILHTAVSGELQATTTAYDGAHSVNDTIRDWGNKFGFPFTREEFVRAHAQVRPRSEAEMRARRIYDPGPELIGVTVMDGDLLLLALLSAEIAERVVAYRPQIRELVQLVRADPKRVIESWDTGENPQHD